MLVSGDFDDFFLSTPFQRQLRVEFASLFFPVQSFTRNAFTYFFLVDPLSV
jgi:hypothetical protein